MKKIHVMKRMLSLLLCAALLAGYIPAAAGAAAVAPEATTVLSTVTDPGTADSWENMMGTPTDGNRYAGRVWVDKSVYKDGDVAILNSRQEAGSTYPVSLGEDEAFQVIFSALGSTMTTTESVTYSGPMDVVLVLDTSTSMDDQDRQGVTRLQRTMEAANKLLKDLLSVGNVRIAIVTYNKDSETVLPLAQYTNGIELVVTDYMNNNSSDAGVVTAYDNDKNLLGQDSGYTSGTNLQSGIDRGFHILAGASDASGRIPVAIILADGQANRASKEGFYEISGHTDKDGATVSNRNLYLSTLLNAAYNKTKVEAHYGKKATVYTVGVDVSDNQVAKLLMNPADATNGFHSTSTNKEIREAYANFQKWAQGNDVTYSSWTFDHNYPTAGGAVTDEKIAANIYYADTYYDVSNTELKVTFAQIYEELTSGVFNPISSSSSVSGATGVEDTPLIYVDYIGRYMQIKEIQFVSLFGATYGVIKNADGTYTVDAGTGTNPTTNERWNTAEDIILTVIPQEDGTQKLEIRIYQQILPIIMERVTANTVGGKTTATITEFLQDPLRVYYTVGMDPAILLPNGKVDVSKIQGYAYIDDASGTVTFYSNRFGVENVADHTQVVTKGDSHVGFQPSPENRYYYHRANQGIFTKITDKTTGSAVTIPENNSYGIVWNDAQYELNWMTYEEYLQAKAGDIVYTYVTYYRPTEDTTDAADAAEEITYLVYTDWQYLKESVAFYDANTKTYLNNGAAIPAAQVAELIAAYRQEHPNARLYAVLGVGSRRTSRLHNMVVNKTANNTQTAVENYTPEYLENKKDHYGNDVVVWLGNNGRLSVSIDTGIALTKAVTESFGNAEDTYALTVTVPAGVTANPVVVDAEGNPVAAGYENNVLTVHVKAGQTVYVTGIPGGTECLIDEVIEGDYYIAGKTHSVTVPLVSQALNGQSQFVSAVVTNAPNQYGNLFITKEITGDHQVPDSVQDTAFTVTVSVGTALAGRKFAVLQKVGETSATSEITVDGSGNMTFQIKAKQTIEILDLPAGTAVTVVEADPGDRFAVSYHTRNHSGEAEDTDNALVIPAGGNATAVIRNRYTPAPVSVDLDIAGTKNFTAEGNHAGGRFTYKVQKWNGTAWEDMAGKTAETAYAANESGTKTFTIENVLAGITYTEVGSYAYQVLEVKGDVANVTYDRTLYTFDVTVVDNGGQLVAAVTDRNHAPITDGSYQVTFHNTYHTAPVSVDIEKIVDNRSGDTTLSGAGFAFTVTQTDANWEPLTGEAAAQMTLYADAAGKARFAATYHGAGSYYYVLRESDAAAAGWTYSAAVYRITVTVTENDGNLSAVLHIEKTDSQNAAEKVTMDGMDATKGTVSFVNIYDPEDATVDLDGAVSKVLTGMTLQADQFTFCVYSDGDRTTPVLMGTNNLKGDVHFVDFDKALTFTGVGTYRYDIVEQIPAEAVYDPVSGKYVLGGMYYDPTVYDLVVEVTNDPATGKLKANYYFEDSVTNTVSFHNSYRAEPVQYALGGVKLLHGRAPRDGEFLFALYEGESFLQRAANKADGSFAFKTITYTQAGTYTYTIREVAGNVAGVVYDGVGKPVTVTVTVTDHNGVLRASASMANGDIRFENTYTANSAQVTFNGTKTLAGGVLADRMFTFRLYRTDQSMDVTKETAQLVASAQNMDGIFSFTETLHTTGTYYFVILEDATADTRENVVYDGTRYKFSVQVSDPGDGQLIAVVTDLNSGVSGAAAASVSAQVAFANAVYDAVTQKEVYLADNVDTQIDGQKVEAGDILTYFITYTNYTGENVVVDIMDTIPNHTVYVEGSASHNGTYAGAHVNWILHVQPGGSVTVSFSVRVKDTEAIVANTAVVRDGVNTYSTNQVVNHTVQRALRKDVFSAVDATVSVDGQQVDRGDALIYRLSFTNASDQAVDIRITDSIPANTTYVEGSADQGGVYEDGRLVWDLRQIPAWSTVTVTFRVTVNADVGAVTIRNQAFATDGSTGYESQIVTNYTVKAMPGMGDTSMLRLLLAMMLLSGAGLVGVVILGSRKKHLR